jgi:hypothetical protein
MDEKETKPGNPQVLIRLPENLRSALQSMADQKAKKESRKVTIQEVILDMLAARCKISIDPPTRGRPKKS